MVYGFISKFQLFGSTWWLQILMGLAIWFLWAASQRYLNEKSLSMPGRRWLISAALAFFGFVWVVETDWHVEINHGLAFVSAFIFMLFTEISIHSADLEDIRKKNESAIIFKRYIKKKGYWEDARGQKNNANTTRFGLVILGRKGGRSFWEWLTRQDGWTDRQRKALLRHEWGHNIAAIPSIFAETLVFYYVFFSILKLNWETLAAIPAALGLITAIAWLEELFGDMLSGLSGFSLFEPVDSQSGWLDYFLGGIGHRSHPPLLLRFFAYALPLLFLLSIVSHIIFDC